MKEQFFKMTLLGIYFDWVNNFITVERMSEYYEIDKEVMSKIIDAAIALYHEEYIAGV